MSEEPVYVSRVTIERLRGPLRQATLPAEAEPVTFGVHSEIARHYGVSPEDFPPHATTLDYVVAAAGGWLTGTLAAALEARGVAIDEGAVRSQVEGDIGKDGDVLVVRAIRVRYRIRLARAHADTVERVHGFHAASCPVARTLRGCVEITTSYELVGD